MQQYECTKCKKPKVVNDKRTTIEIKCCQGESLVKHVALDDRIIVPVAEMPKINLPTGPLPLSTPAPKTSPTIIPAKK